MIQKLIRGDCIQQMAKLEKRCAHLVFADPPFNIGYAYDKYEDNLVYTKYIVWSRKWIAEVVRILKSDGSFWIAIGDEYAAELKVLCTQEFSLTCRNWVIWYYTFGVHCQRKFTRSHVHLLYFVKDPNHFTFNADTIRVPSARQTVYKDKRACSKGRIPDDTWILRPQDLTEGFIENQDTWNYPRVCGTFKERAGFHGCQMPEALLERIISSCSYEGDLVVDPFAGSGTTLVAAKRLQSNYIGIELSGSYVKEIQKRLDKVVVDG